MDILTKTFQKYAQGHAQVAQHTDSNWAIFLKPFAKSPSLGEEERNSCSQKITAVMFSRQNLVHALVKISFARGSCFSSFLKGLKKGSILSLRKNLRTSDVT